MAYKTPKAIAEAACGAACAKTALSSSKQIVLGFLAGAFIAFGGLLAIVVGKGSTVFAQPEFAGLGKFVFGGVFPVGLMLVIIAGAELFTGNCGVIPTGCLSKQTSWTGLLRNWGFVYLGNFIGSVFVALFIAYWTGIVNGGGLGEAAAAIAEGKVALTWGQAILRGIGCNWLVVLAVWMALASDDIGGKILAIWFPIMAFVTLGLEHSIANMFFIPLGMLNGANVTIGQFLFSNLLPVTIGNIIGGAVFVGAAYWWIYLREDAPAPASAPAKGKAQLAKAK
jgi:formate/nitrite transporter